MSESIQHFSLSEWQTLTPENTPELRGVFLTTGDRSTTLANALSKSRKIAITELREGIQIKSFSYVGTVRIGSIRITIRPKIEARSLLSLLRYTFGLRRLNLISETRHALDDCGFEDLLISQLVAEASELITRGLSRSYIEQHENLLMPRGRLNVNRLALAGATPSAALPCDYYSRVEDVQINRILKAGLQLAALLANQLELRRNANRLVSQLEEDVSSIKLDSQSMKLAERDLNRSNVAYIPSLSIIKILMESQSIVLDGQEESTKLSGFLFDMNSFFQSLMSRFLRENLGGLQVVDEHGLKSMMNYNLDYNPRSRRSPTPRPDYAILDNGKTCMLLDAKYRDLWEHTLPPSMLYQLVVYAISIPGNPRSAILYPTISTTAQEARIDVQNPVSGNALGQVSLRPVNLLHLAELLTQNNRSTKITRSQMARRLSFGI